MKKIQFLVLFLFPLLSMAQVTPGRITLNPDQSPRPTLRNTRNLAVDTLTNELILTPPGTAPRIRIPTITTVVPIIRSSLSAVSGLSLNQSTGVLSFTGGVSDVSGLTAILANKAALSDFTSLTTTVAGKEPAITAGSTGQWLKWDKTFAAITTSDISGLSTALAGKQATITPGGLSLTALNISGTGSSSTYLRGDGTWSPVSSTGGSSNTVANIGTAGVPIYKTIVGTEFQFKKVYSSDNLLTIADDTGNDRVTFTVNQGNLAIGQSQVSGLTSTLSGKEPTFSAGTSGQWLRWDKTFAAITQSDVSGLTTALSGKEPTITAGTSGQVILGNKTLGTLNPTLVGLPNVTNALQVINNGGANSFGAGVLSSRPTVGTSGRMYYATDNNTWYYDNGTTWAVTEPAISGDVAISAGGTTATIQPNTVTLAKFQQLATKTYVGRTSAGTGNAEVVTAATLKADLAITASDVSGAEATTNKAVDFSTVDNTKYPTVAATKAQLDTKPTLMTLASLTANSASTPPAAVQFTDSGKPGIYVYDATDTTTPDNGGTVIVTAAGKRFKLTNRERISVLQFPIVAGTGQTTAVRKANRQYLIAAANSGYSYSIPNGVIEADSTITVTNKPIDWMGIGEKSAIRWVNDTRGIVINQTDATYKTNLEKIRFEAAGNFTTGVGLTINNYPTQGSGSAEYIYQKHFGTLRNLSFIGDRTFEQLPGSQWPSAWKGGIEMTNPNVMEVENLYVQGNRNGKTDGTFGLQVTTTRATISFTLQNPKIYDVTNGIRFVNTGSPGYEGVYINEGVTAGNYNSIRFENTNAYTPIALYITNHHSEATHTNLYVQNCRQSHFSHNLFYNQGNNNSGDYAAFIEADRLSNADISHNEFIYQPIDTTRANDPYGILIAGSSTSFAVLNRIVNNTISLRANGNKAAVWLQSYAVNNFVEANKANNALLNGAYVKTLAFNYIEDTNYPLEDADAANTITYQGQLVGGVTPDQTGAYMSFVNGINASAGWNLDLTFNRGKYVYIPSTFADAGGAIKTIYMRAGKQFTLQFDKAVTLTHDNTKLRLLTGANYTTAVGEIMVFRSIGGGITQQMPAGPSINDLAANTAQPWSGSKDATEHTNSRNRAFHTGTQPLSSISQSSASTGQLAGWNGTAWAPVSGAAPTGTAGGILTGTYPNPGVGSLVIPLSALSQSAATTGQVPQWNGSAWVAATVSMMGSGEANTGANVGTLGVGVAAGTKTGVAINFRNIAPGSSKMTFSLDGNNNILGDVVQANLSIAGSQLTGNVTSSFISDKGSANGLATLDASTKIPFAQLPGGATNTQSGTTYTFVATDCNKKIYFTSSSAVTVTIPASVVVAGCSVNWVQKGTGQVTFAAGSGLTLTSYSSYLKSAGQYAMGTVDFESTTAATLGGTISN